MFTYEASTQPADAKIGQNGWQPQAIYGLWNEDHLLLMRMTQVQIRMCVLARPSYFIEVTSLHFGLLKGHAQ